MAFDEIAVQKGLVRVLQPLLDLDLARLKFQNSSGNWVEDATQPAIYLGYPNEIVPAYPRVHITFNGDTDTTSSAYEAGLVDIEDPQDPPNIITVPFKSSYVTYILSITCDSGDKGEVNRGTVKSASTILRQIRDNLLLDTFRGTVHTEMDSTVKFINPITPIYDLEETSFHDSAVMNLTFDTTSIVFDFVNEWFDRIEENGELFRNKADIDPLTSTRTVGPVTP